jgi:hypothetical protein
MTGDRVARTTFLDSLDRWAFATCCNQFASRDFRLHDNSTEVSLVSPACYAIDEAIMLVVGFLVLDIPTTEPAAQAQVEELDRPPV